MKRYVYVDEADELLPAARMRAVPWRSSVICARQAGAASY
jgi:hypothetical protein